MRDKETSERTFCVMIKYEYLLFDADDTLFDFPRASSQAFETMCRTHNIPCTPEVYRLYHEINLELWAAFDRGELTKEFVTLERYVRFLKVLGLERDPAACNRDFLAALGKGVYPLPHAEEVCRELKARGHRMYIITNAVASVQRSRLRGSVFAELFEAAFISEEAGAAKPNKAYFDYVRRQLPGMTDENALVIGDSLTTDMQGANNAGLPCCWVNPAGKRQEGLRIDYEITGLRELLDIV